MLFKLKIIHCSIEAILVICTFIGQSYQQITTITNTLNKELKFCIQNHTMSNTLQTFWHEANADCELEPQRLTQLYDQLQTASSAQEDQCSALLKHQIRKKIILILSTQLGDAIIMQALKTNRELQKNLKELQEIDERVAQLIWERVMSEVYLFVEPEKIVNEILLFKEPEIQTTALQSLLSKYLYLDGRLGDTLMPLLTYRTNVLLKDKSSGGVTVNKSLERLYRRLPKALRFLYESATQTIGLLNYQHFEYLYAPRDNGPDNERRLPLTWSETKNSTDSDGHLVASFNQKGLLALGSRFGSSLKYLYADMDQQAPYFWIGSGLKSSQWWHVLWPHESLSTEVSDYIMLKNEISKELLCAAKEYDENRRYVALLSATEHMENPACFWLATKL